MRFASVVLIGHDDGGLLAKRIQSSKNSTSVEIKGVVLLGVSLSREVVPGFTKILLCTSLGKKHLVRPLLGTEITQVLNWRAWYDAAKLTTEVLRRLYKRLVAISGCGHLPREECPKALLAAISPFLSGLVLNPDLQNQ
ncbi:hypothetical protein ACH5RR_024558 [Cinchona calisaya]|uniref:Uncharacterized protein n=1 Tax=Cinchona calisaya TaxID=153742 RepID=A0ABD2YZ40_9GENT